MYKEKVTINSNEADKFLNLKVSTIFRYFQQVSTAHAELIHAGTKEVIDKGMCWVLIRMEVDIYDYPKYNEEVIVSTHPGETNKFIFPRFYQLYSKKGKLYAAGSSMWVVLDKSTRRIVPRPFPDTTFKAESSKEDIPLPEKVVASDLELLETRVVRNSDIDLNGHLNNTKYVDYILDTKAPGFFDKNILTRIIINYDKELKEGESVALFINNNENIVQGRLDDKECFTAKLEFKERR